eukprot:354575-Chlamydomonas_euryale.AAC.19
MGPMTRQSVGGCPWVRLAGEIREVGMGEAVVDEFYHGWAGQRPRVRGRLCGRKDSAATAPPGCRLPTTAPASGVAARPCKHGRARHAQAVCVGVCGGHKGGGAVAVSVAFETLSVECAASRGLVKGTVYEYQQLQQRHKIQDSIDMIRVQEGVTRVCTCESHAPYLACVVHTLERASSSAASARAYPKCSSSSRAPSLLMRRGGRGRDRGGEGTGGEEKGQGG